MNIINFKSTADKIHPDYFKGSRNISEMDEEAIIMPCQRLHQDMTDAQVMKAKREIAPDVIEDFMNPFADQDGDWLLDLEDIFKN